MKLVSVVTATSLVTLAACQQAQAPSAAPPAPEGWKPQQTASPQRASSPTTAATTQGPVVETFNSGGYTYVQVDAGASGKVWAAGPNTAVKVGDTVGFSGGMAMTNFHSKTLNRTFDAIYFVSGFRVGGAASAPASRPSTAQPSPPSAPVKVGKIDKVAGGLTVAEVFAQSEALAGKQIMLRGQVVKYNGGIMGKNWLHIQDGTGGAGTNDLTVTTDATAEVGDVIVVKGVLATNKDFGSGYKFALLLEDATVTK